jgi:acyl-CoA hydrolase
MEVGVKVWVEDLLTGDVQHTSSAYLTFVAIEEHGKCVPIIPVIPETPDEKRRYDEALARRQYRLEQRKRSKP